MVYARFFCLKHHFPALQPCDGCRGRRRNDLYIVHPSKKESLPGTEDSQSGLISWIISLSCEGGGGATDSPILGQRHPTPTPYTSSSPRLFLAPPQPPWRCGRGMRLSRGESAGWDATKVLQLYSQVALWRLPSLHNLQ